MKVTATMQGAQKEGENVCITKGAKKQGQIKHQKKSEIEDFNRKLSSKREREREIRYPTSLLEGLTWCEYPVNLGKRT